MPRPKNTDARRAQIAGAMIRVVAARGYEGASVHDVAREAGIAPGLVHYHFKRKLDVLLEMQSVIVAEHLARVERWMSRGDTAAGRIRAFIDCHLARGAEEDPEALACWIALTAEALRDPEVREGFDRGVRAIVALLEASVADELRNRHQSPQDARAIATALFAAVQGYYALHGASPGLIPPGSAAPAVHRLAEGLLGWAAAPTHSARPTPKGDRTP